MSRKYTAFYEYGDDGWWTVRIKEVAGVHSQGRSIKQARTRVFEALSLFVEDVEKSDIEDDIHLGDALETVVRRASAARKKAEIYLAKADELNLKLAKTLTAKMSVRDAGEVLGLSYQRVHQIAKMAAAKSRPARKVVKLKGSSKSRRDGGRRGAVA